VTICRQDATTAVAAKPLPAPGHQSVPFLSEFWVVDRLLAHVSPEKINESNVSTRNEETNGQIQQNFPWSFSGQHPVTEDDVARLTRRNCFKRVGCLFRTTRGRQ